MKPPPTPRHTSRDSHPRRLADAGMGTRSSEPPLPQYFGAYQILGRIGRGGLASVLRARHIHPGYADRPLALKLLDERFSRDAQVQRLFRSEAYLLALLEHPNIVRTFEAGEEDGRLFIAMEAVSGVDLAKLLARLGKQSRRVPLALALYIVGETLRALAYAHALADADGRPLELVHRDVNPSNVLISYGGHVKLGDFGVARILAGRTEAQEMTAGKVGYFAPEQLRGDKVDRRADLFAVGIMLYELVCGARPFVGADEVAVLERNAAVDYAPPRRVNPEISAELAALIERAMHKKARKRFESAEAMLEALHAHLPASADLRLGLAALVREAFLDAFGATVQLEGELRGRDAVTERRPVLALCSPRSEVALPLERMLVSSGFHVVLWQSSGQAIEHVTDPEAPRIVLVDLAAVGSSPQAVGAALRRGGHVMRLGAVVDGYDVASLQAAAALGVDELFVRPIPPEVLTTSMALDHRGIERLDFVVAPKAPGAGKDAGTALPLFVSGLEPELEAQLGRHGFEPLATPDAISAAQRCERRSPRALVIDLERTPFDDALHLVETVRRAPGMAMVPALFISRASLPKDRRLPRRARHLGIPLDAAAIAAALGELFAETREGRTFARYPVELAAELRYGGRGVRGKSADLSRGGLLLYCAQMPPLGTGVGIAITLPNETRPIEAQARVVRVQLPDGTHGGDAGIGLELERLASGDEARLIRYVSQCAGQTG